MTTTIDHTALLSQCKPRYSAVVESGSCSPDYTRWEERASCGHAHRTYDAAAACLAKHQRSYCRHGRIAGLACASCLGGTARGESTSALWYSGTIHNQRGERTNGVEMTPAERSAECTRQNEEREREMAAWEAEGQRLMDEDLAALDRFEAGV